MATELTLFSAGATDPRRMGTKRIAELTGKRHDQVLRDVRGMCEGLGITPVIATPQNCGVDSEGVTAEQYPNGDVAQYHLTEHYCLVLATGYSVRLRDLIIGEWEQLKRQHKALPDFTNPEEAALAYIEQAQKYVGEYRRAQRLAAENAELEQEKAVLAPKAHMADMVADTTRLFSVNEVAKMLDLLKVGPNRLFDILRKRKAVYRTNGINYPYQRYVELGYFKVRMIEVYNSGEPRVIPQIMITGKGFGWVIGLVEDERSERASAVMDRMVWRGPETN